MMIDSKLRKARIMKRHREQYLMLLFCERRKIFGESYNSSSRYQNLDAVNQEGRHTGPKPAVERISGKAPSAAIRSQMI